MSLLRGSRGIATIIGGVLLAIALLALIALYFYLEEQHQELVNTLSRTVETRLGSSTLASSLDAYYYYSVWTSTLYITVESNAPRAVTITALTILWSNTSTTIVDRGIVLSSIGASATLTSLDGTTTPIDKLPVTMAPGDTLDITISNVPSPVSITLTLSASPVVVTIPIREKTNVTAPSLANVTQPFTRLLLLPRPIGGYIVAEKYYSIIEKGPHLAQPQSYTIYRGSYVNGNARSLLYRDGDALVIEAQRGPLCPGLDGWQYMRRITIVNPNPYPYNDIQVRIELNSSNFDFNHAKSDGSDIRILDANCNPLDYWVEKWDKDAQEAIIWVKIPHIDSESNKTILLVYGNPSAGWDTAHEGLLKVMTQLPASDGPGYTIQYQEWIMSIHGLIGGGTPQGWHADDNAWRHSLPFAFPFYDRELSYIWVCSNGFISASRITDYIDSVSKLKRRLMIAPFWEDLMTSRDGHDIFILEDYSDSYGTGIVIRWFADFYPHHGVANFEVVLYSNGLIRFNYGDINGRGSDRPTIGISLGDGIHYTISTYSNRKADDLSNAYSLLFWPRKKPSTELIADIGEEELFYKYIIVLDIVYPISSSYIHLLNFLVRGNAASPYIYSVSLYSGEALIKRLYGIASDGSLNLNTSLNIRVSGTLFRVKVVTVSDNTYQLSIDQLVFTYNEIELSSPAIYIASNISPAIYVVDPATFSISNISLDEAGFPEEGYTALAPDPGNAGLWIARGRLLREYIVANDTWAYNTTLSQPLGPGGFIAYNGTHIYYCPGYNTSAIYIIDPTTGSIAGTIQLPYQVTEWANTAQAGSILYIHTGTSGHLLEMSLTNGAINDLGVAPFLYPAGMDYDPSTTSIVFILRGGGIDYYNVTTGYWNTISWPIPYYPLSPGDRLVIIDRKLYHVRGDYTSEILVADIGRLYASS